MKHLITAFVAIACIVAGGIGGHMLRSGPGGGAPQGGGASSVAETPDAGQEPDTASAVTQAASSKGSNVPATKSAGRGGSALHFYRFSREFVVPMLENGRVSSLVILNISLEIDPAISTRLFSIEPALRDSIMTTLIALSNDGRTFESITKLENYESLRAMVLMNLQTVVPDGIHNVLIMDMARQDI
jgi:flagellar FliL protein